MNNHKPQRKICECQNVFWTSAGRKTMCAACSKAHHEEFLAWLDSLPDDEHAAVCERICAEAAALGVTVTHTTTEPASLTQVDADDQDDVDNAFRDLMDGLDL